MNQENVSSKTYNKAKQWTPQPVTFFVPKNPPSCSAIVSGVMFFGEL